MQDILSEPVIRVSLEGGRQERMSLPEVYTALMRNEVMGFPALRPHQKHAWHQFLVQLAAMSVMRAELDHPPEAPEQWREIILALTPEEARDSAWELVGEDTTKPAFLQPPVRDAEELSQFKTNLSTPDEVDVLQTSKNFEVKKRVIERAEPDDWLFALVSVQTMAGYDGNGHRRVSRMNGGYSSRTRIGLAPQGGAGAEVRRDIEVLLQEANRASEEKTPLVWTMPWGGEEGEQIELDTLNPLYIEICRRVRLLSRPDGGIRLIQANAKSDRTNSKHLNGVTGDPWTPVKLPQAKGEEPKSFSMGAKGFRNRQLLQIMTSSDEWQIPALLEPQKDEIEGRKGEIFLVAQGLGREQGKTKGHHEVRIRLGPNIMRAMVDPESNHEMKQVLDSREADLGKVKNAMSDGISTYLAQGRAEDRAKYREATYEWRDQLERQIDLTAIPDLEEELALSKEEREQARGRWLRNGKNGVIDQARRVLADATLTHGGQTVFKPGQRAAIREMETSLRRDPKLTELVQGDPVEPPEEPERPETGPPPPGRGAAASRIAETITMRANQDGRTLTELQRLDRTSPEGDQFEDLQDEFFPGASQELQRDWALIVQGMASAVTINHGTLQYQNPHNGAKPLGWTIRQGAEHQVSPGLVSEMQARNLTKSRGGSRRREAAGLMLRIRNAGAKANWEELADFILEEEDRRRDQEACRYILQEYERAKRSHGFR